MSEGMAVSPMLQSGPTRARVAVMYAAMIVAAVGLFLAIDGWGQRLAAPDGGAFAHEPAAIHEPDTIHEPAAVHEPAVGRPKSDALPRVLAALTAVVIVGRLLGMAFRRVGQPPVIGEVVGGIVLGPSLLGWLWPEAMEFLFPAAVVPLLGVFAQFGVILYMFLVGLELNPGVLRERAHATVAISHASIAAPFLLGAGLALYLYPRFSNSDVPFTSFALFLGVAMAITAFPVLARILTDRGLQTSRLGMIALACAATNDVTAWLLLAFVVGVAQAQVGGALVVAIMTIAYIAFMLLLVQPTLGRRLGRIEESQLSSGTIALVFAGLLLSALATEAIGIHAIFGAFLFGAIVPHDCPLSRALTHKLEDLVTILFLPAFFAFTGLRTQIGLVSGFDQWLACGLIILMATAGKFGGTYAAARFTGFARRDSAALGVLMNTRGLMELIVLNTGLDLKIISPTLFAMMVLMALVTTIATTPVLQILGTLTPRRSRAAAATSP
jgi:Kef-type K+ transport system membrane component KefB